MKELPLEIWCTVINHRLLSAKQLGECRLVCRKWDSIAEKAMFGGELAIDIKNAAKFYSHLSNKSASGHYIKHLDFDDDYRISDHRTGIVQLGFTPAIQSLSGNMEDEQYIQQLINIVQASPVKFSNMKSIITYLPQGSNFPELACLFKNSLQKLSLEVCLSPESPLSPSEAILSLDEFVQLEYLALDVWGHPGLSVWEDLLQKCYRLTSLKIEIDREGMEEENEEEMAARRRLQGNNRIIRDAQKFTGLQRFELFGGVQHGLCRYFLHKFPNVQGIQFHLGFITPDVYDELLSVLAALKSRESYHVDYSLHDEGEFNFAAIFESVKKEAKSLSVEYSKPSFFGYDTAMVIVDGQKATARYNLILPKLSADSSFSFLNINCGSAFNSLALNFSNLQITDPDLSKTLVFVEAMLKLNQLERLDLTIDHIKEADITQKQLPLHNKLATMKITGAQIDASVFSTFDTCFPALKSFTLDRCQIANTDVTVSKMYPVALPQRSLQTIAIVGLPASERPTLLHLELLSKASGLYFLLLPFQSIPMQLTKEQFENHAVGPSFIFAVTCQNVNIVKIKQGNISLVLHVNKYHMYK